MTEIKLTQTIANLVPDQGSDNGGVYPWALPDGGSVSVPWQQAYINAGYGFHVTVGAFSTPITGGGAGTVLDADQPEFVISVPSGTRIIPVRFHVQCQLPLIATDADESEILIAVDRTAAWDAVGTSTAETVFGMKTDNTVSSLCTVASAFTGNMTGAPTLGIELARAVAIGDVQGTAANANWGHLELLYEPKFAPVIVGPAMVVGYWGGTVATPGFAQMQWLEFPAALNAPFATA